MAGPAVNSRTLAEAATAELHRMILSGEVPPSQPLRLAELAETLQMSQMPIREALRRLAALGIVEIVPHKGAYVRALTREDFIDTNATRLTLETVAVEKAAQRRDLDAFDRAEEAIARHEELINAGDLVAARDAHTAFHFTIYRASGSWWLPRAIEPVWENSERYRFALPADAQRRQQSHDEHAAILQACRRGEPETASVALRLHLERAGERVLALLERHRLAS